MLTNADRERIEDLTGITPDQLRRLERTEFVIARYPVVAVVPAMPPAQYSAFIHAFRLSEARMPFYGCPSEAH